MQEFAGTPHEPDKLAVYDAAVNIEGSIDTSWLDDFEAAVNAGKVGHAVAHLKKGMQPATALSKIPEPVLAGLMALVSRTRVNKMARELMPTGVGELRAAYDEAEHARDFAVLPANTHFMAGGKSPRYYKVTARRLHVAAPAAPSSCPPRATTVPSRPR